MVHTLLDSHYFTDYYIINAPTNMMSCASSTKIAIIGILVGIRIITIAVIIKVIKIIIRMEKISNGLRLSKLIAGNG